MNYLFSLSGIMDDQYDEIPADILLTVKNNSNDFIVTDTNSGFSYQVLFGTLVNKDLCSLSDLLANIMDNVVCNDLTIYVTPVAKLTLDSLMELNSALS